MTFTSFPFLIFLAVALTFYWGLSRRRSARIAVLILTGYYFYSSFNPVFMALLAGVSLVDYFLARLMGEGEKTGRRKLLVAVSVIVDLSLLAAFKYFNFFGQAISDGLALAGVSFEFTPWKIPLPVGISFYVFQSLSYTIDVYRGRQKPLASVFDYFAFMAFFPRLVAGPIVRMKEFSSALDERPKLGRTEFGLAIFLLITGFLKKMAIADYLRENIVDRVFDFPAMYQLPEVLAAAFGFTFQIYCDFSGYTDIALGLALLFGIRLPENFDFPYLSESLSEFWRRWHMSLSFWLRDYLYISLGGNRGAAWKTYRNLFLTMLLGGLWHGSAWTFVIWGGLHGGALAVTRFYERIREKANRAPSKSIPLRAIKIFFTFLFVSFAWIFFRATDFRAAKELIAQFANFSLGATNLTRGVMITLAVAIAGMWFPPSWYKRVRDAFVKLPIPVQILAAAGVGFFIYKVSASSIAPFVYEQF